MSGNQSVYLEKPLDHLIFDRVTKDVVEGNKKGYYNFNDLNRIESWCRYLSDYLNKYNYTNSVTTKTNWVMADLPYNAELERIRKNIKTLKDIYISISEIPENLNFMNIDKANIIEKILDEIDYILSGMENNFVYCGIADCGRTGIWQQRFRKSKSWISQPYKLFQYVDTDTLKTISEPKDENTLLLLHGTAISDASMNKKSVICEGVVVSTNQKKFRESSLFFNGNSRILVEPTNFFKNDWTIDWWEYALDGAGARFSGAYTTGDYWGNLVIGHIGMNTYASTSPTLNNWNVISGMTMMHNNINTWVHRAFIKKGNTLTSYLNGQAIAIATLNGDIGFDSNYPMAIGDYRADDHNHFIGYIDEFRISNIARWTQNFEVSKHEYVLVEPIKIVNSTSILGLAQIDKRDDIYASIMKINESMENLDRLVGA